MLELKTQFQIKFMSTVYTSLTYTIATIQELTKTC